MVWIRLGACKMMRTKMVLGLVEWSLATVRDVLTRTTGVHTELAGPGGEPVQGESSQCRHTCAIRVRVRVRVRVRAGLGDNDGRGTHMAGMEQAASLHTAVVVASSEAAVATVMAASSKGVVKRAAAGTSESVGGAAAASLEVVGVGCA